MLFNGTFKARHALFTQYPKHIFVSKNMKDVVFYLQCSNSADYDLRSFVLQQKSATLGRNWYFLIFEFIRAISLQIECLMKIFCSEVAILQLNFTKLLIKKISNKGFGKFRVKFQTIWLYLKPWILNKKIMVLVNSFRNINKMSCPKAAMPLNQ